MDLPLLLLLILLIASLYAFFGGWIPYPFGWMVLTVFLLARLLYLSHRK